MASLKTNPPVLVVLVTGSLQVIFSLNVINALTSVPRSISRPESSKVIPGPVSPEFNVNILSLISKFWEVTVVVDPDTVRLPVIVKFGADKSPVDGL